MAKIKSIEANWILDSRGLPTVTCTVFIEQSGAMYSGSGSVPSGASTGSYEAVELRDNEMQFHGKGVYKAIENINTTIADEIIDKDFSSAQEVDISTISIDGTENKSNLGANATLAVSLAIHRAFANLSSLDLWQYIRRLYFSHLPATKVYPRLMSNVINGGAHADNDLAIQEFMIVPKSGDLEADVQIISEVYHTLKKTLKTQNLSTNIGDEGGFAPAIDNSFQAVDIINTSIKEAGYSGIDFDLAMDAAANEFFSEELQKYKIDGETLSTSSLVEYYKKLTLDNPNIFSIEDPFHEDDNIGWSVMTKVLGKKIQIVGDDLFVTNTKRFTTLALDENIANSVLIKPNQIGTIHETAQMINLAKENNYSTIVSHRSGETEDDFISDLTFASQSEFIKLGAPARGERVAKFNRLLEIKRSLEE